MNAREVALHVDRDEPVAVRAARGLREHERTLSVDCVVAEPTLTRRARLCRIVRPCVNKHAKRGRSGVLPRLCGVVLARLLLTARLDGHRVADEHADLPTVVPSSRAQSCRAIVPSSLQSSCPSSRAGQSCRSVVRAVVRLQAYALLARANLFMVVALCWLLKALTALQNGWKSRTGHFLLILPVCNG